MTTPEAPLPFALRAHLTGVTMLAALIHDIGKASKGFQKVLASSVKGKREFSTIRHEFVSAWVAHLMLHERKTWREAWDEVAMRHQILRAPITRIDTPTTLAIAMALTHHRLIGGKVTGSSCSPDAAPYLNSKDGWRAEDATLAYPKWRAYENDSARGQFSRLTEMLAGRPGAHTIDALPAALADVQLDDDQKKAIPALFLLGRTAMQMADHHYSATGKPSDTLKDQKPDLRCAANTIETGGKRQLHQPLDEHLAGVCANVEPAIEALEIARHELPRIDATAITLPGESNKRFAWQQDAVDLTAKARSTAPHAGFFGVLNASTGRGKTIASLRVAATAAGENARITITSPMRVLARQIHDDYAKRTMLDPASLALAVGGIHIDIAQSKPPAGPVGNSDTTSDDDLEVYSSTSHSAPPALQRFIGRSRKSEEFVSAPVLCCTVDYINRAAEPHRGSHLIAHMRLVSADVVVDEADDYDLPALLRLAYIVGLAGRNLFISTATMHAQAVDSLYRAYREGYESFCAMRGLPIATHVLLLSESEQCWLASPEQILQETQELWSRRIAHAKAQAPLRIGKIIEIPPGAEPQEAFDAILGHIRSLHDAHHVNDKGRRVSAGVIRLDRVKDCADFLIHLAQHRDRVGIPCKVLMNHGGFTNAERAYKNHKLAKMLRRGSEADALLADTDIQGMLEQFEDSTFLVITTAAGERGNDLDFDWGIMEPTSIESMIQMAGRLNRHRQTAKTQPSLGILRYPINDGKGFAKDVHRVAARDAGRALCDDFLAKIDSRALLGDPEMEGMPMLEVALSRLLNEDDFFPKLEASRRRGYLGIAMASLYEPPLRERDDQLTIEIDEAGDFRSTETGQRIASGYQRFDDSMFDGLMLGRWKRRDVYDFVTKEGGLSTEQQKVGRELTHPKYRSPVTFVCSDAFGLST